MCKNVNYFQPLLSISLLCSLYSFVEALVSGMSFYS